MKGQTLTAELLQAVDETEIGSLIGIIHRQKKYSRDSDREPYIATRHILGLLSENTLRLKDGEVVIPTSVTVDSDITNPLDDIDENLITEEMRQRYRLQDITIERVFEEDFGKGLRHPIIYNELYDEDPAYYQKSHPAVEVAFGQRLESSDAITFAKGRPELATFFAQYVSLS